LLQHAQQRTASAQPRRRVKMLPARQEVGVDGEGNGTHLVAQDRQRAAVHLFQDAAVDELRRGAGWRRRREAAVRQRARFDQVVKRGLQPVGWERVARADGVERDRAGLCKKARQDFVAGAVSGLGCRLSGPARIGVVLQN
jgi:hypothetical protein